MTCERCADLCVLYPIRKPREFRRALAIAAENVADGTLSEVPDPEAPPLDQPTFAAVAAGGQWGDFTTFRFRCTQCGECFVLFAETYHGSGGSWRPENQDRGLQPPRSPRG